MLGTADRHAKPAAARSAQGRTSLRRDEPRFGGNGGAARSPSARRPAYFPAFTSSSAISRSLNFWTFMDGVMGKSSTKNTRLGTL